jgi:hypothetical protein
MTEQPAHEQKRRLIETIHADALRMQEIDERESMTLMTVDEVMEYYDQLVPHTKDAQVILAAVEAEFYIRRSERIAQEPLSQGGRPRESQTVTPRVTVSDAERKERSRMRAVGENAAAAREYVKGEVKANRKATRRGVVRHAQRHARRHIKRVTPSNQMKSKPSSVKGGWSIERLDAYRTQVFTKLDAIADGTRRTDRQLQATVGDVEEFVRRVRFIPWLRMDRTREGTIVTIDHELREICEGRRARPEIGDFTWRGFYQHLRAEITRRRKEANDLYRAANWRHGMIHTQHQSELLDWIEDELNRIP